MNKDSTKSNTHYRIPGKLWKMLKKHLPKAPKEPLTMRQPLRFRYGTFAVTKTDNQPFNANERKKKQPGFLISQQAGYATVSARL